ncbi:hypothetical protein BV25DRAFT_996079 [Artomyces pyxidatus]|uniref:Uncharacterized protein n=1 Tax=Artomyces pyxidatus TaxID=48021 RepID=A0ACB8SVE2_9AGAM|nr:hypothetical protein BV25DRAFT_996079 [Artomyces pyxidatus]
MAWIRRSCSARERSCSEPCCSTSRCRSDELQNDLSGPATFLAEQVEWSRHYADSRTPSCDGLTLCYNNSTDVSLHRLPATLPLPLPCTHVSALHPLPRVHTATFFARPEHEVNRLQLHNIASRDGLQIRADYLPARPRSLSCTPCACFPCYVHPLLQLFRTWGVGVGPRTAWPDLCFCTSAAPHRARRPLLVQMRGCCPTLPFYSSVGPGSLSMLS